MTTIHVICEDQDFSDHHMLRALLWLLEDVYKWWKSALRDIKTWTEAQMALNNRYEYGQYNLTLWNRIGQYGQRFGQLVVDYLVLMNDKFAEFSRGLKEVDKT